MNKEKLLQKILNNEELKSKYWRDVDTESLNTRTLSRENNTYLKALYHLINETNETRFTGMINNIKRVFKL